MPAARSLSSILRRSRTRAYSRISWCSPCGRVPRAAHRCAPANDTARVSGGRHKARVKTAEGVGPVSPGRSRSGGEAVPDAQIGRDVSRVRRLRLDLAA
jgi:hypothetical protein